MFFDAELINLLNQMKQNVDTSSHHFCLLLIVLEHFPTFVKKPFIVLVIKGITIIKHVMIAFLINLIRHL